MSTDQQGANILPFDPSGLTDSQLLILIALKRLPFEHETWKDLGTSAVKMALRSLNETLLLNSPTRETVHPALDKYIAHDTKTIERLYKLCLNRQPKTSEVEAWDSNPLVSTNALCNYLLYSYESYRADGLTECCDEEAFNRNKKIHICTELSDEFAKRARHLPGISNVRPDPVTVRVDSRKRAKVALNSFGISENDLNFVSKRVFNNFGIEIEFQNVDVTQIVDGGALEEYDIFLTGNNNLYQRLDEQLQTISGASARTAVWLWDNHHQYDLSIRCSQAFDIIFPAHSNGHSYLYGNKAIVGPVVPCCVVQWSYDEVRSFFMKYGEHERSNELYGKFNSYAGRNALRDQFLKETHAEISSEVQVISADRNDWHHRNIEDRYKELATRKIILCNTIFNDVPARLFDALMVGAVPILPYGLPDVGQCFSRDDINKLPLIQYIPNDLQSLRKATDVARRAFDTGDRVATITRHLNIAENHLFRNRMERMISEVLVSMSF